MLFCFTIVLGVPIRIGYGVTSYLLPPIEVFDTSQGKVIVKVNNSSDIQKEVKRWVAKITEASPQANLGTKNELMIRVPLESASYVQISGVMTGYISEVIIVLGGSDPASGSKLLLFDEENQPILVKCNYNFYPFLKKIGIK